MRCCVKIHAGTKRYILSMGHVRMTRVGVASGRKRGDIGWRNNVG